MKYLHILGTRQVPVTITAVRVHFPKLAWLPTLDDTLTDTHLDLTVKASGRRVGKAARRVRLALLSSHLHDLRERVSHA